MLKNWVKKQGVPVLADDVFPLRRDQLKSSVLSFSYPHAVASSKSHKRVGGQNPLKNLMSSSAMSPSCSLPRFASNAMANSPARATWN